MVVVAEKFKRGDEVRHKTGSPVMLVIEVSGTEIMCEWFEDGRKTAIFDVIALEHYSRESENWDSLEADGDFMSS
jgi:uncharacterized protein YodC (DUF2158 family)